MASLQDVLNCRSLPSLPAIALELLEVTRDPDVAMKDIATLVEQDPGLATKVLRTVNSSYYALSKPCTTIDRALTYLGLSTVKSIVLGFSLVDSTKGVAEGEGFDLTHHWRRAIYSGAAARQLAKEVRSVDADEAFTATLFQDMGMLASFVALGPEYVEVLESAPADHGELQEHERAELGFDHAQVGASLAEKWKFADQLVAAVKFHHKPDRAPPQHMNLVRLVTLARLTADALSCEDPARYVTPLQNWGTEWFGIDTEIEVLLREVADAAGTLADLFAQDVGDPPKIEGILADARDQAEEHQLAVQLEAQNLARQTVTDALTGAANRKRFDEEINQAFQEAQAGGGSLAVLFLDADKFKLVNDNHGHQAGDAVLVELAERATEVVGDDGLVCRYGGEEFAVILPTSGVTHASEVAERLRAAIAATPIDLSGVEGTPDELRVTVSVGVSAMDGADPARLASAEQLVKEADDCVYAAKRAGRNAVKVYPNGLADEDAAPAPEQASSPSVLLIEDDDLAATLIKVVIRKTGDVELRWAKSVEQAIALLQASKPTVIVADHTLPDGNGPDVVSTLRESVGDEVPIHMIYTGIDPEREEACRAAGSESCVSKEAICRGLDAWVQSVLGVPARAAA